MRARQLTSPDKVKSGITGNNHSSAVPRQTNVPRKTVRLTTLWLRPDNGPYRNQRYVFLPEYGRAGQYKPELSFAPQCCYRAMADLNPSHKCVYSGFLTRQPVMLRSNAIFATQKSQGFADKHTISKRQSVQEMGGITRFRSEVSVAVQHNTSYDIRSRQQFSKPSGTKVDVALNSFFLRSYRIRSDRLNQVIYLIISLG